MPTGASIARQRVERGAFHGNVRGRVRQPQHLLRNAAQSAVASLAKLLRKEPFSRTQRSALDLLQYRLRCCRIAQFVQKTRTPFAPRRARRSPVRAQCDLVVACPFGAASEPVDEIGTHSFEQATRAPSPERLQHFQGDRPIPRRFESMKRASQRAHLEEIVEFAALTKLTMARVERIRLEAQHAEVLQHERAEVGVRIAEEQNLRDGDNVEIAHAAHRKFRANDFTCAPIGITRRYANDLRAFTQAACTRVRKQFGKLIACENVENLVGRRRRIELDERAAHQFR